MLPRLELVKTIESRIEKYQGQPTRIRIQIETPLIEATTNKYNCSAGADRGVSNE